MPRENLLSLFREFERCARDAAVVQRRGYRREVWTYSKLAKVAVTCALALRERGVRTGDRVLLWGPNSAEWVAAFWGCLLRGAVAVPMDNGATPEFAARVARDVAVKHILQSSEKPLLDHAIPRLALEDLAYTVSSSRVVMTHHTPGEAPKAFY
jgi:long-chain acyl-CoA synthetase